MLGLMSVPKKWEMGDGEIAEVSTPWTNRAKELEVNVILQLRVQQRASQCNKIDVQEHV